MEVEAAMKCQLQGRIENAGIHFGCRPDSYSADVFWQTVRCELTQPGKPAVPLIARAQGTAGVAAANAAPMPLEVDSSSSFALAGHLDRLPALVQRGDDAQQRSSWQLGFRWEWEEAAEDATALPGEVASSNVLLRWRSSEQLAILCNHCGTQLAFHMLGRLLGADQGVIGDESGPASSAAVSKKKKKRKGSRMALSRILSMVRGLTLSVEIDFTTPVWLIATNPASASTTALEVRARSVQLKASLQPTDEREPLGGPASPSLARKSSPAP
eukprot:1575576-Prymnesium_polylepis.1